MSNHRYSKFWWQDWRNDPALQVCCLAARGLWIEMLAIAHDGSPTGHLTVNGKSPSPRQLAAMVRASEKEVKKLLLELEDAGVFSRTDANVIYSRRMVRDADKSAEGKEYAEKRWGNTQPPNGGPNGAGSGKLNGSPTREPSTQYSEAYSEALSEAPTGQKNSELEFAREPVRHPPPGSAPASGIGSQATAAVVVALQKGLRMTAYPPRKAERSPADQVEAIAPTRPKASHLTPEQLALVRGRRTG